MEEEEIKLDLPKDLDPDESQALLAFNTNLMESQMPQEEMAEEGEGQAVGDEMALEGQEAQESAPQQGQMAQPQNTKVTELEGKFEQFKEDINKTIDDKIGQIGEMIKQALSEDEETPKE